MKSKNKLKILHVLSQRPDSTGSGIYVQAMIREATACGYDNFLVAGLDSTFCDDTGCIEHDKSMIKPPRLRFIDQPYQEDEWVFEQNLQESIQQQINAAYHHGQIDMSLIQEKLTSYTWTGVFKKVRKAYLKCLT